MSDVSQLWGSADYERLAEHFGPIHEDMVVRLGAAPGVSWLDVATGTGGVALRAAQAGADVTGVDIAPRLVELARAKADGLHARFDVGDAEALPYGDRAFEVVTSVFGVIFAPDHSAVARQLARVCAGRLGLTVWRPNEGLRNLYTGLGLDPPEGRATMEWGRDGYVEQLLGDAFDLEIEARTWIQEGADGEELWQLWSTAAPPFKAMVESLDGRRREELHRAYVEYCERFPHDGGVAVPREYLLVVGRRR